MADKHHLVELLRFELQFLREGGYGRSPRKPWIQPIALLDSPTCLNFGDSARTIPCSECPLMQFVPAEKRAELIPCHHIPLDEEGETLDSLYRWGSQAELEEKLANWLQKTLTELDSGGTRNHGSGGGPLEMAS